MHRTVLALPLAALLALGACATAERYRDMLAQFEGASEEELIEHWGVPHRSHETADKRYLAYTRTYYDYVPPAPPPPHWRHDPLWGGYGYPAVPPRIRQYGCETTFVLEEGRVTEWRTAGNACVM